MASELATLMPREQADGRALTVADLRGRLALIQDAMKQVMQENVDFGTIPGTDKPALFKPGGEKICVLLGLTTGTPVIESLGEDGEVRYRVTVPIRTSDGKMLAAGVGECSSGEEKYRWRRPVHKNEYDAALPDRKREKFTRQGDVWQQVRVEPADIANTILKMAHKRAYLHGVIMATGASAIFSQDLEDMSDEVREAVTGGERRAPVPQPQRRSAAGGAAPRPATNGGGGAVISEPQVRRLRAIKAEASVSDDVLQEHLAANYPYTLSEDGGQAHYSLHLILRRDYDAICKWVEGK